MLHHEYTEWRTPDIIWNCENIRRLVIPLDKHKVFFAIAGQQWQHSSLNEGLAFSMSPHLAWIVSPRELCLRSTNLFFLCRCHSVSLASSLKHLRKIYKLVKLILCSDVPAMPILWYHISYLNHSRIVVQLHYLDTTFDMTAVSYIADHARFRFFSSC